MISSETKHLISIEDFPNVGPEHTAYPQAYNLKFCVLCSNEATKSALFDIGNNVIAQEKYCNRHIGGIKKYYSAGSQAVSESYFFEDKSTD
jgi:hypothetical protein